jgi:hypothetical protein
MTGYRYDYRWLVLMPARPSGSDDFAVLVSRFGAAVVRKLGSRAGQPEAQLREPFARLLAEAGTAMGVDVLTVDETPLDALGVRPDYMVSVAGARVGYAELKARGRKVPTTWTPTAREQAQWQKLRLLPNVLYTDGEQWAVYRYGELQGTVARLEGDLRTAGSKLRPADSAFERVLQDFLLWKPDPPRTIGQLVHAVANLCRLLRDEVSETLQRERSGAEPEPIFTTLAEDWREYLFPGLSDADFADAYAQTVTFALLLARVDGISFEGIGLPEIARQLGKQHSLMGKALDVLTERTVERRSIVVTTLERVVGAVDWDTLSHGRSETYLHLYEHFLEDYDAELRRRSGSYYTPNEVVAFMVRFVEEILRSRMGIGWRLAADEVMIVDPAMGTGTYLLNIIDSVARTIAEEEGASAVAPQLRSLFGRLIGFEKQASPYAVAELRIHQALKAGYKAEIPERQVKFFVADTLDDPYIEQVHIPLTLEPIARSRREANKIKRDMPVLVVIGNPPYGERARGLGGWIESGNPGAGQMPPMNAFRAAGRGRYEYVLSNLYVYFWRWATWKVFDAHDDHPAGIVAFITPSSFTTGAGYAGMREYLRRTADEGWIIDVSPENFRPEVNTRVFPGVQHRLCIAVFVRYGVPATGRPARIHHVAVSGDREQKFSRLASLGIKDPGWLECATGWQDLLVPSTGLGWRQLPALGDLMPWSLPGVKSNRAWVYAPDSATLRQRWSRLIRADRADKAELLKDTGDRSITSTPERLPGSPGRTPPLDQETSEAAAIEPVALRSFDRQCVIYDARVIDRPRPPLWQVRGAGQVYVTEQHADPIESGPGLIFSAMVPEQHHFNGRGGRVLPLYRDPSGLAPNIAPGLAQAIGQRLETSVSAEDMLAYIAAVVAHPAYTTRFAAELTTPGIRVPLTADPALWAEAVKLGQIVVWLHTYGERFASTTDGRPKGPPKIPGSRRPRVVATIPDTADQMPAEISYDPATETLRIGKGKIQPVPEQVWNYDVSGMRIIRHWFDYRKQNPRGRWSSPLDDINPAEWPPRFTTELLELVNVLTWCVELEPHQAELLDRIYAAPMITVDDLELAKVFPVPGSARKAPSPEDPDVLTLI